MLVTPPKVTWVVGGCKDAHIRHRDPIETPPKGRGREGGGEVIQGAVLPINRRRDEGEGGVPSATEKRDPWNNREHSVHLLRPPA